MQNRLLKPNEISCRVQQINEKGLSLLLYVTSRAGQVLLDEKYGPLGWQDSYKVIDGDLYCSISAWDNGKQQWVTREDVGTASYTAKEKGRASDAFKRACVKHGIARELYSAPFIWIDRGQCNIKDNNGKFTTYDKFKISEITYNGSNEIDSLEIINQNLDIVYKLYPSGKIDNIKLELIKDKAGEADVSLEEICSLLKIKQIEDLDINSFKPVMNKLNTTIEKRVKSKES